MFKVEVPGTLGWSLFKRFWSRIFLGIGYPLPFPRAAHNWSNVTLFGLEWEKWDPLVFDFNAEWHFEVFVLQKEEKYWTCWYLSWSWEWLRHRTCPLFVYGRFEQKQQVRCIVIRHLLTSQCGNAFLRPYSIFRIFCLKFFGFFNQLSFRIRFCFLFWKNIHTLPSPTKPRPFPKSSFGFQIAGQFVVEEGRRVIFFLRSEAFCFQISPDTSTHHCNFFSKTFLVYSTKQTSFAPVSTIPIKRSRFVFRNK